MKNNFTRDYCLRMKGSVIKEVPSYVYQGQAITMDNDLTIEIGRRRKAGWATFNKYRDVLFDERLDTQIRARVFNTHDLPALVYGSETWSTIIDEERRLASTQRAMERAMCTLTLMHKIPAREIRRRTGVKDEPRFHGASAGKHSRRSDDNEQPHQDELPMDMDDLDEGNREEVDVARRTLKARIHVLRIRFQTLHNKQPCRPRQYSKGMRPGHQTETRMRCIFCGTRGDHYLDSCGRVRDSKRSRILLKRHCRCVNCLKIGCLEKETVLKQARDRGEDMDLLCTQIFPQILTRMMRQGTKWIP
ncbi:hypothetical protein TELCIR_04339 [Teladorsagia circumcincta]|uniref:Uncharacterized protein n=1 Tax=Teladorsagia circumcincta TaxID=45464 RepID=A0A2G9UVD5_TELCI|nr:hypothetical protein TELCIR_04339 [Teladorsagia circumcincta]